jgi:hypothetical protein
MVSRLSREFADLDYIISTATESGWSAGDRRSVCLLGSYPTGSKLVASRRAGA